MIFSLFAGLIVWALPSRAQTAETLKVCLEEDSPPYSFKFRKRRGGFDLALSQAIADALGRDLAVQWFESENDDENIQAWEANALLSERLCDLIAGYPMFASALRTPPLATGALPEYDGQPRNERGRIVDLGTLIASRPYHRAAFAVIVGPAAADRTIATLGDLDGLRIGVEVATLSSAILFRAAGGRLVDDLNNVRLSQGVLAQLEAGQFDATLIELHRFDQYRKRNPDTELRWSGYLHPVGFNMGFIALARNAGLLEQVNGTLTDLMVDGSLKQLASDAGLSYVAPAKPDILVTLTPAMLASD